MSYGDVLRVAEPALGVTLEAIRSYPEVSATARIAGAARHLRTRYQTTLEEATADFAAVARKVCDFAGVDGQDVAGLLRILSQHDPSNPPKGSAPTNVTRNMKEAPSVERWLRTDELFCSLYADTGRDMGFDIRPAPKGCVLSPGVAERIVAALRSGSSDAFGPLPAHGPMLDEAHDPAFTTFWDVHLRTASAIQAALDSVS
jgi:hypothetical protein